MTLTLGCATRSLAFTPTLTFNQQAHELPVVDLCHMHKDLKESRYDGIYNCSDGSWVLANSSCCEHTRDSDHHPTRTCLAAHPHPTCSSASDDLYSHFQADAFCVARA